MTDEKAPPNHRYFQGNSKTDPILIARRHHQPQKSSAPPVIVNIHGQSVTSGTNQSVDAAPVSNSTDDAAMNKPPMLLAEYCAKYGLSDKIMDKAKEIKITGAHGFYFIVKASLEQHFQAGELADIQFAKLRWLKATD
jgi:hypothetical protein